MTAPSEKFTRQWRRALERLTPKIDRVTAADRKFFERHPDRSHRLRLAAEAEAEIAQLGAEETLPAGIRWFVAVRQVAPGMRLRAFGAETDADEATCAEVFARASRRRP